MAHLLQSELFRLSRRLMPRALLLIEVGIVVLLYLLLWSAVRTASSSNQSENIENLRESLRLGVVRDFGLGLAHQVGTILVVILSASTVGTEHSWGTIRTILPRASGRSAFLSAKVVSLALFVVVVVLLGFVAAFLASALVTSAEGLDGGLGDRFLPDTLAALGRAMYTMLPYAAIAVGVAVWTRSGAAAIGVGLAALIIEGPLTGAIAAAGGPFEILPKILISANVQAVMRANVVDPDASFVDTSRDLLNPWAAALVLAGYTAGALALAYWRFQKRDITSG
jgi:ABC-type transport system involved in multi-copper enzyme maturation permease subunit